MAQEVRDRGELWRRDRLRGEEPELRCRCRGPCARRERGPATAKELILLEAAENLPRARHDLGREAGEPRDLDAVAPIRAARDDLPQEHDVVLELARRDVRVDDAGHALREIRQL